MSEDRLPREVETDTAASMTEPLSEPVPIADSVKPQESLSLDDIIELYAEEVTHTPADIVEESAEKLVNLSSQGTPYRHVGLIDDLAPEDPAGTTGFLSTLELQRTGMFSKSSKRTALKRDIAYGQYLQVPGRRSNIFISKERRMNAKTILALLILLCVLAGVVWFVWSYMQREWGTTNGVETSLFQQALDAVGTLFSGR